MLVELINLLPESVNQTTPTLAGGIALAGALLALAGARFSRRIIALSLVAVGAIIGLHLPKWMGWSIDAMGPAFGAAVLLGLSGFILDGAWEAMLLGGLFATWISAIVWIHLAPGQGWAWPTLDPSMTAVEMVVKVYQSLPAAVNKAFPAAVVVGLASGCLFAPLYPRVGRVLLYSLGGLTLFVLSGAICAQQARPAWMASVPLNGARQVEIFLSAMALCMGVQGLLLPRTPRRKVEKEESSTKQTPAGKVT